jgi:hypothetical protein
MFCRQNTTNFNGYHITTRNDTLVVFKFINNNYSSVFYGKSWDINKTGDNLITVSKSGSKFHLFVNDIFQGEFTDSQWDSGDIALFLLPNSSITLGTVSMTDEFQNRPNSFSDNFSDINLKYWQHIEYLQSVKPELSINGQAGLNAKINSNSPLGMYIEVNSTEFEASVGVTHSSGSTTIPYGILLVGEAPSGAPPPMIYFGIRGDQRFSITGANGTQGPTSNSNIIGQAPFLAVDNIVVKKSAASSTFEFIVNGTTLSNDLPVGEFKTVGIGLFSYNTQGSESMQLIFSNFSAEWKNTTSITWKPNQRPTNGSKYLTKNSGKTYYDLMGRKRFSVGQPLSKGVQTRAAGMYLNEQGREIRVRKTPQK